MQDTEMYDQKGGFPAGLAQELQDEAEKSRRSFSSVVIDHLRMSANPLRFLRGLRFASSFSMTADRKRKDPFKFIYKGTLVFAGNALQTFKSIDGSDALISRMTLLVFNTSVKAEDQDREMDEKLFRERNLIVSLALDELHELIKSDFKFTYGDDELQMLSQYKESVNTVQAFIDHACELAEESRMYICDVYVGTSSQAAIESWLTITR